MPTKLDFEYDAKPITADHVKKFETRNKLKLPQEVIDFRLEHNGAAWDWEYPAYKIHGNRYQKEGLLQVFFALAPGDANDIERVYRVHKGRLPAALLAIGSDPGNNLICIGLKGEHLGKIYWWERTKEESRPTFKNVQRFAGHPGR